MVANKVTPLQFKIHSYLPEPRFHCYLPSKLNCHQVADNSHAVSIQI